MIQIEKIQGELAKVLCQKITAELPEYFGLPEANKHYATGVTKRINFAAKIGENYIGLISIDFPYPDNANIYWMAVRRDFHRQGFGKQLIDEACHFAITQGANTITVETLSPTESEENYLKTYLFYQSVGFKALFDLKPAGYEWNMAYMMKQLNQVTCPFQLIDLTHTLDENSPAWDDGCGFSSSTVLDYADCTGETTFRVQHLTMPAGMGTHMDAPAHCCPNGLSIAQIPLNN